MEQTSQAKNNLFTISRYRFLRILRTAIECEEYQFGKQAAMLWLANFPGDLFVQYFQALTHEKLGKTNEAKAIYEGLIDIDPFFAEPYLSLSHLIQDKNLSSYYQSIYQYLTHPTRPEDNFTDWMSALWNARDAFTNDNYDNALENIHLSLIKDPPTPIPAVLHLKTVYKMDNQAMMSNLSEIYYEKWPKCLDINIIKAISEINDGSEASAVERLHWVAAHDSAGQVITRLMGNHHRFASLWPENLDVYFDIPIPATVSGRLGLNQLQSGFLAEPEFKTTPEELASFAAGPQDITQPIQVINVSQLIDDLLLSEGKENITNRKAEVDDQIELGEQNDAIIEDPGRELDGIQKTFAKLAKRLKKPDLERADNRFPLYVIMSSKKQLEVSYGPNTTDVINNELQKLVNLLQKLPQWGAMLFYPDDPAQMAQLGLSPRIVSDPWQAKSALSDLDASLAKRGEMVGALLIIGGPEIIPFHHLPNPTLDNDLDVPSDNPYATIDENYFIPQWPVGRLPGESGSDAGLLLYQIRHLIYKYQSKTKSFKSKGVNFFSLLNSVWQFMTNLGSRLQSSENLGYSAEIWREASEEVYKSIGKPGGLKLSPPVNSRTLLTNNQHKYELGYFNLHGIKDGPNWYGQKDFASQNNGLDYPIALSPEMFSDDQKSPDFILTEACYGANVINKHHEEALALKFLDNGTNAFVGSTCIAYGSVTTPLIAADFVAERFWHQVLEGQPAGYALMQAKLDLAREMTQLQGFLDGEDQKTLLSFILFGDPLAKYDGLKGIPKPLLRFKSRPRVKTISDSDLGVAINENELPDNVSRQVKKAVEKYLPGLKDSQIKINKSETLDQGKSNQSQKTERYVLTFEKSVENSSFTQHYHYARMTFDKRGKLIKISTSR
jgi:hypothetical protein